MKAPAVLVNARAGGVLRDPDLVGRIRARLPGDRLRVTSDPGEVEAALSDLLATGADTLVIVGGDGTAGGTLTALVRARGEERLPRVVLAGGGTVNTVARSLGARRRPEVNVARWISAQRPQLEATRPLLRVVPQDGEPSYGMLFGNGAIYRWLEHYDQTNGGPVAAAWTVARSIGSVLIRGPLSDQLFAPIDGRIEIDDEPPRDTRFTAVAAGTVRDIGLGFRPFRTAGDTPDRFHWIETAATGREMSLELPAQLLGRDRPASDLRHASPQRVRIRTRAPLPYMIDADLFPPTRDLLIEAGPPIRFAQA